MKLISLQENYSGMILEESRSGVLTARVGSRYIHSKYDPLKESRQLIDSFRKTSEYSTDKFIILLEPGLGYLLSNILEFHDPTRIAVIFYNSDTYSYCSKEPGFSRIPLYLAADTSELHDFLDSLSEITELKDLLFLEPPSSASLYEDESRLIHQEIMNALRINQGNILTKRHFARRWYFNGIRNFLQISAPVRIKSLSGPIIITASGPTLSKSIDKIREFKENAVIAALPSSLKALNAYGIKPDILFSTDPGFYAREHLKHLNEGTIVISPITGSVSRCSTLLCGIDQKSFIERLLLKPGDLESHPEMGTVAATAITYLASRTSSSIYISGLDLCMTDISMHVRPHSFDPLILNRESRLSPGYGEYFKRAFSMTESLCGSYRLTKSMNTYRSWFSKQSFGSRVVRINSTPVTLPVKEAATLPPDVFCSAKEIILERNNSYPDRAERVHRVSSLVDRLKKALDRFRKSGELDQWLVKFAQEILPACWDDFCTNPEETESSFVSTIDEVIKTTEGILNGQ